jgi:hypothetical protein
VFLNQCAASHCISASFCQITARYWIEWAWNERKETNENFRNEYLIRASQELRKVLGTQYGFWKVLQIFKLFNLRFITSIVQPTRCTSFSNLFYFEIKLYLFRTVISFIIRSSRLYIQQQVYVKKILLTDC